MSTSPLPHAPQDAESAADRIKAMRSFAEFYPFYLGEHSNRTCRRLHFLGSSLALACLVAWAAACSMWKNPPKGWAGATGGEQLERLLWEEVKAKNWKVEYMEEPVKGVFSLKTATSEIWCLINPAGGGGEMYQVEISEKAGIAKKAGRSLIAMRSS